MAENEIARAQEETRLIRENAEATARQAQEEVETARHHARVAITLAQEKVKEAEEVVRQAHDESRLAKEKAEASIKKVNGQITRARQVIMDSSSRENADREPTGENTSESEDYHHLGQALHSPQGMDNPVSKDAIKDMYDSLHSISGFTRMMLDDNIADRTAQKEFLTIILQQSEALKHRLDSLSR